MKITKYVHSCLLVEADDLSVLIDPGRYSWDSHLLNLNHLPHLSHIVITHEHADHYHEPALRNLSQRFPHAVIVTNNDLADKIKDHNLPNTVTSGSDDKVIVFEAPHAELPLNLPSVLNIGVHIDNQLTHTGDALDLSNCKDILALPLTSPFAGMTQTLKQMVELKPKVILPIHDWHWHQQARESLYKMAKDLLVKHNIDFIELKNAETIEL